LKRKMLLTEIRSVNFGLPDSGISSIIKMDAMKQNPEQIMKGK